MPLLRVSGHRLRDGHNREVILHGINVSGDAKLPSRPDQPSQVAADFFNGEAVSFADVCIAPQLHFARRFGIDLEPFPTLRTIDGACAALPSFVQAHADNQPDAESA